MFSTKSRAVAAYGSVSLEARVAGSGSHELVTMLFEGFLERVRFTKIAIGQHDVNAKVKHLNKAIQILSEGLRTHLDTRSGGELAQNLDALYHYCSVRLIDANVKNDVEALDEVHDLIEPVAAAWKQNWSGAKSDIAMKPLAQVVSSSALGHAASMQQKIFASLSAYGGSPMFAGA
jgi:flagellar protein FliS